MAHRISDTFTALLLMVLSLQVHGLKNTTARQQRFEQIHESCLNATRYVCADGQEKALCLRKIYQQFLRDLPIDKSTLERLHQEGRSPLGPSCIYKSPTQDAANQPAICENSFFEKRNKYSTCPWEWERVDRGDQVYPAKRDMARCLCQNCHSTTKMAKLRGDFIIKSSRCQPVTTFLPVLVKQSSERWKFFLEPITLACFCGTDLNFR